ncbi:hypothetical protein [Corynebacterium renale]|uniref:hypothetical protein n=1 Tax=Corynebacterium renale TaxID=1724 RepID=UPI000A8199AF|nr:hypothetical protein [Corynebacterium renale]
MTPEDFARHRSTQLSTHGLWTGLLDENGTWLCDLPHPTSLSARTTRNATETLQLTIPVQPQPGHIHPCVPHLIDPSIGTTDNTGTLQPVEKTRLIVIERNGLRQAFRAGPRRVEFNAHGPVLIEIQGADIASYLWQIPCVSNPASWKGRWFTAIRDWVGESHNLKTFTTPRRIQDIKFSEAYDTVIVEGPALATVEKIIDESLAAVFTAIGVTTNPPIVVEKQPAQESPWLMIHPSDKPLGEDTIPLAASAGITVSTYLWLPGDPQPKGHRLQVATIVVRCSQQKEDK